MLSCASPQVEVGQVEVELAGIDLGDEQQVVDEPSQAVSVASDDREELALLVRKLVRSGFEDELEVAVDRGERSAKLVRDRRDELILESVEFAQAVCRLLERSSAGRLGFLPLDHSNHSQQDQSEQDHGAAGNHDPVASRRRSEQAGDRRDECCDCRDREPGPGGAAAGVRRGSGCNAVDGCRPDAPKRR